MKYTVPVAALTLLLTACGSGSDSKSAGPTATGSSTASTSTSAATATTSGGKAATSAAADGNPVDGVAFCAFLAGIAPRLKTDGAAAGAKADFAIELANWIGNHPTQKPRTAADLDDASQKTCPKTRASAVASMGATSFDDALS